MVVVLCLTSSAAAQEKAEPKRLDLGLYLEMEDVDSPQISPDGTQIIYTRQRVDKMNDRRASSLWIMNADGSKNRFLVDGRGARWSPNGDRIAYRAQGEPGGTQIFVRWMDPEGATTQITHVERRPSNLAWSPDGTQIAFTMVVQEKNTWPVKMPNAPAGARWTEPPRIIERLVYRQDRTGFTDDTYRHLFVVPASGGTPRQLTDGDWNTSRPGGSASVAWTPDGQSILFSSLRTDDWEYRPQESEIYAVDIEERSIRRLPSRKGIVRGQAVSPNGRWVAYIEMNGGRRYSYTSDLYVMGIDGSNPRVLTRSLDRWSSDPHWAPDNSGVYFSVEDRGTINLYFSSLEGEVTQVTRGNHALEDIDINAHGQAVGTLSSYYKPDDVVIFNVHNPELTQLTFVNDDILADVELGEVEEIWYASADDYRAHGWIFKPPDFDPSKKYPLILTIHGACSGAAYEVDFSFSRHNHAAHGYVVLATNPRGSTGYGGTVGTSRKEVCPDKDFDDLMNGVDEVIKRGYIDERNLFVYGCSQGGRLTAWIVGHTDRFAAAAANCPITNWLSFAGTGDWGPIWYHQFEKMPWEDPSEHLEKSPLMYVGNVTTPTMLMTGVDDLRTPISQTEEFYQALKMVKVPTAMVRFNREWHGTTSRPSNFLRTQLYLRHWFERFMSKTEEKGKEEGAR